MGGGGAGALMSGRGAADALAKMTQVAGGFFLVTSLALTLLSGAASSEGRSVLDMLPRNAPVTLPASPAPTPTQPTPPDPTQSSAPQAAQSQLAAAVLPGPSSAQAATPQVAPPSTTAGSRAAPLQVRSSQTQAAATPLQTATPNRGASTPASTGARPATRTTTGRRRDTAFRRRNQPGWRPTAPDPADIAGRPSAERWPNRARIERCCAAGSPSARWPRPVT